MGTNEFNRKAYDQRLIRFPLGTIKRFKKLFESDLSFNAFVVELVISQLDMTEIQFTEDKNQ